MATFNGNTLANIMKQAGEKIKASEPMQQFQPAVEAPVPIEDYFSTQHPQQPQPQQPQFQPMAQFPLPVPYSEPEQQGGLFGSLASPRDEEYSGLEAEESEVPDRQPLASSGYPDVNPFDTDLLPGYAKGPGVLQMFDEWTREPAERTETVGAGEERFHTPFSDIFEMLGSEPTAPLEEGRVGLYSAQGEDIPYLLPYSEAKDMTSEALRGELEKYDTKQNQRTSGLSLDTLALADWIEGRRIEPAEDSAEYMYKVGDKGLFTEEEIGNIQQKTAAFLPSGRIVDAEDFAAIEGINTRQPLPGEEPSGISEEGNPYKVDGWMLPDGTTLTNEDVVGVQSYDYQVFPNGQIVTEGDFIPAEYGGTYEKVQTNPGMLNMGKVDPSAPWEDIGDILPYGADLLLGSTPYMIPYYNKALGLARADVASRGLDDSTFDWRDYGFDDDGFNKGQQLGMITSAAADVGSEYLGGRQPGLSKGGPLAMALDRIPGYDRIPVVPRSAIEEGLEEPLSSLAELLASGGFQNYGSNVDLDPETGEVGYVDTPFFDRVGNIVSAIGEGFAGGALMGGALEGGLQGYGKIRDRIIGQKMADNAAASAIPEEQLRALEQMYAERDGTDGE